MLGANGASLRLGENLVATDAEWIPVMNHLAHTSLLTNAAIRGTARPLGPIVDLAVPLSATLVVATLRLH